MHLNVALQPVGSTAYGRQWTNRTCVPFDERKEDAVALVGHLRSFNICGSFVDYYLHGRIQGVSLPRAFLYSNGANEAGNPSGTFRRTFKALFVTTLKFFLATLGKEMTYVVTHEDEISQRLADLQWDDSSMEDIKRRLGILVCTTLFPPCVAPDELTKNGSDGASGLSEIRPCSWLCGDAKHALLPLAQRVTPVDKQFDLQSNSLYQLMFKMAESCTDAGSNGLENGEMCLNCTNPGCESFKWDQEVTNDHAPSERSVARRNLCYNATTPCKGPFIFTTNTNHWNSEVQSGLRDSVTALRLLLNMSSDIMPYGGSAMGCALACKSFLFSQGEVDTLRKILEPLTWIAVVVCVFSLLSFMLDCKRMCRFPVLIWLFLTFSVLLMNFGLGAQFFFGNPSFICHPDDNSLRRETPFSGPGSAKCTISFLFSYYFSLVSSLWWMCFAHSWYITTKRLEMAQGTKSVQYYTWIYHAVTWPLPVVFILPVAVTKNAGGVVYFGMCWILDENYRFGFLVIPLAVACLVGCAFMSMACGTRKLFRIRKDVLRMWRNGSLSFTSSQRQDSIQAKTTRYLVLGMVYLVVALLFILVHIAVGIYRRVNSDDWVQQVKTHLKCVMATCEQNVQQCPALPRPNAYVLASPIVTVGPFAVVVCSWAMCNPRILSLWAELVRNVFSRSRAICEDILHHTGLGKAFGRGDQCSSTHTDISVKLKSTASLLDLNTGNAPESPMAEIITGTPTSISVQV